MKKAYLIKDNLSDFTGNTSLYILSEPLSGYEWGDPDDEGYEEPPKYRYVVCSATRVLGVPETYIFGSSSNGEIVAWGELPGSQKHTLSHEEVLLAAGYTLVHDKSEKQALIDQFTELITKI